MKPAETKHKFFVKNIKKETADVSTFFLSPEKEEFDFTAGQYVTLYLNNDKESQGKFYTISSSPGEPLLALSVKKIGHFSSAIHKLKSGDPVYLSGPYGWFFPTSGMESVVFLAAGIGVTPFLSILRDHQNNNIRQKIDLYYANRVLADAVFLEELKAFKSHLPYKFCHFLTRDSSSDFSNQGHIKISDIRKGSGQFSGKYFFICGPIGFVSDMRKQLLSSGVQEEHIFTEAFFQ